MPLRAQAAAPDGPREAPMGTETRTADRQRRRAADRTVPPRAAKRLDRRKVNQSGAQDGKKIIRRKKPEGKGRKPAVPDAAARTARSDFGLSRATFARMTGVPESTLADWERDKA